VFQLRKPTPTVDESAFIHILSSVGHITKQYIIRPHLGSHKSFHNLKQMYRKVASKSTDNNPILGPLVPMLISLGEVVAVARHSSNIGFFFWKA
jgi:hypothetical protein